MTCDLGDACANFMLLVNVAPGRTKTSRIEFELYNPFTIHTICPTTVRPNAEAFDHFSFASCMNKMWPLLQWIRACTEMGAGASKEFFLF